MKKEFLLFIISCSCFFGNAQNKYKVSGQIRNGAKEGSVVIRYFSNDKLYKDTGVIKNGKFIVNGLLVSGPILGKIIVKELHASHPANTITSEILLEPTDIIIHVSGNKMINFSGSLNQILFSQLLQKLQSVYVQLSRINERYLLAQNKNDQTTIDNLDEQISNLHKERQVILADFILLNPSSIVSALKFDEFMGDEEIDPIVVEPVYEHLSENIKSIPAIAEAGKRIAIAKATAIGQKAIDFEQTDTSGNSIRLSAFKGKFVLIDFWAGWCIPCRKENPQLLKMYSMYKTNGLEIIGVSLDGDRHEWISAIVQDQLPWINVSDLKVFENEIAKLYGINSIPQNFLIDKEGIIVGRNLKGKKLQEKLKLLMTINH